MEGCKKKGVPESNTQNAALKLYYVLCFDLMKLKS